MQWIPTTMHQEGRLVTLLLISASSPPSIGVFGENSEQSSRYQHLYQGGGP